MKMKPVLLVEDDDNDILFFQRAWKKAEVSNPLHVVTDGQQALNYLGGVEEYADRKAYPLPCLVLLDLNLPFRTGFEVLEWIRKHPEHGTLLVMILTSSSAETDAQRSYLLGANSYVIKPSNPGKLRELVALIIQFWIAWNFAPPGCGQEMGLSGIPAEGRSTL
jgi:CheY-like chemotaxis protein